MPIDSGARNNARGMLRRGSAVSSPSAAAPSKPANDRKPNTAAVATASSDVPLGSLNASANEDSCPAGADPPISFAKITTTRMTIRVTEMPSIVSSDRVATRMSPAAMNEISAAETSAIQIQSAVSEIPVDARNDEKNRPTSALDATVKHRYVPSSAQPARNPARAPSVNPVSA